MSGIYNPTKPYNERIRQLIRDTHPRKGPLIVRPDGKRFERLMDETHWKDFTFKDASDTIGSKGLLHWLMGTLPNGMQDAFAMVSGDLMEGGFIPFSLQDYIQIQEEDDEQIFASVQKLRDLCVENSWETSDGRKYPIAITGGDTSVVNTIQGCEIAITATGYVRKGEKIIPDAQPGDVLIGIASNGVHSNGFTFYREKLDKRGIGLQTQVSTTTVGEELVRPTHIYMPALRELIKEMRPYIRGMVHITGGGFSKLRELIPEGRDIDIEVGRIHRLKPQEIFWYAFEELGMPSEDMYTRFNNGVGYVVAVSPTKVEPALSIVRKYFSADTIGQITRGQRRVLVESEYENKTIVL
ncbi:MAG: hypothetical protein HYS80_01165 [Candidatus Aenigmarchaeota archaeon]|nr:hypothetical protein [Candidatus Aenigmarchaeota archaeon]